MDTDANFIGGDDQFKSEDCPGPVLIISDDPNPPTDERHQRGGEYIEVPSTQEKDIKEFDCECHEPEQYLEKKAEMTNPDFFDNGKNFSHIEINGRSCDCWFGEEYDEGDWDSMNQKIRRMKDAFAHIQANKMIRVPFNVHQINTKGRAEFLKFTNDKEQGNLDDVARALDVDASDAQYIFADYDWNEDGHVNMLEFLAFMFDREGYAGWGENWDKPVDNLGFWGHELVDPVARANWLFDLNPTWDDEDHLYESQARDCLDWLYGRSIVPYLYDYVFDGCYGEWKKTERLDATNYMNEHKEEVPF